MGDHIRVDLGLLVATTTALQGLRDDFTNAGSIVATNHDAVGAKELLSALHDFADGWKHHRKTLVSSIDAVEKMVDTSHGAYVTVDGRLAEDLVAGQNGTPR